MDIKINIKIKMEKGKEINLNSDEAKELYYKLKDLYEKQFVTVNPYNPVYPYWTTCNITDNTKGNDTIYTITNNI
jgi:hypothetical protein